MFTHHHDATAIAAVNSACGVPVYFVHHSDHRPSLGASSSSYIHVDMARHMAELCRQCIGSNVVFWPQGMEDFGEKAFVYPIDNINSASSGNIMKFAFDGELAYQNIVLNVLQTITGEHVHIGYLPDEKIQLIRQTLSSNGIAPDRFVYVSGVLSLWGFLKDSNVNVFIGTAPLGGLRTAIEVQGVGIPILPYRQPAMKPFLGDASHYSVNTLHWSDTNELKECLNKVHMNHSALSKSSRDYYMEEFSHMAMIKAIGESHSRELRL
jgi:hypothetical protein